MKNTSIVEKIMRQAETALCRMASRAIEDAAQELIRAGVDDQLQFELASGLPGLLDRFARYLGYNFEVLQGKQTRKIETGEYPALSIVGEHFLEAANAIEGMVAYARNVNFSSLLAFGTRLDALIDSTQIDETNNPLDPDKVAQAFVDALAPIQIQPQHTLTIYRRFNQVVLRDMDRVLDKANEICLANGVLPDLEIDARSKDAIKKHRGRYRPDTPVLERVFSRRQEAGMDDGRKDAGQLYATVCNLLRNGSVPVDGSAFHGTDALPAELVIPASVITARHFPGSLVTELGLIPLSMRPGMVVGDRQLAALDSEELLVLLDCVHERLVEQVNQEGRLQVDHRYVTEYLGQALLESSNPGYVDGIDGESFEKILAVALLYEAFGRDVSLIKPIRELIVATQVVMMKIALIDESLFSREDHPARLLLNEVASAGVGWIDVEKLRTDNTYNTMETLVLRLVTEFDGNLGLIDELLGELYESRDAAGPESAQPSLSTEPETDEFKQRVAGVNSYVRDRIAERINEPLHPVVSEIVNTHFHRFLVSVVERDGQGSNSWILVIKILDLLLWTVRSNKAESDSRRFERFNPLLLANLKKVLQVSGLDDAAGDELLEKFQAVQALSFENAVTAPSSADAVATAPQEILESASAVIAGDALSSPQAGAKVQAGDYLSQVDELPIGVWVRFRMQGQKYTYCSLAARVESADRLVFLNRQGVKVVEKTRDGLARELCDGTVHIVGEWPLFERGLEAVIASLRERSALLVA